MDGPKEVSMNVVKNGGKGKCSCRSTVKDFALRVTLVVVVIGIHTMSKESQDESFILTILLSVTLEKHQCNLLASEHGQNDTFLCVLCEVLTFN